MRLSKLIKILLPIGVLLVVVVVVIPPFTRKWYRNHAVQFAPQVPASEWKKFSSSQGRFSVWFPGAPVETNQIVTNETMTVEQHVFYVNPDIQNVYIVGYSDSKMFEEAVNSGKAQGFMKESESRALTVANGEVLSEKETAVGDYPAREFEYKAGGKANYSVRARYVMVRERMYALTTIFLTGNPYPEDRDNFFKSFQIRN